MTTLRVDLSELASDLIPAPAPYAVLVPENTPGPVPLCLTLHGGGSNRDFLAEQKPLMEAMMNDGRLPPMVLATASTGELSYYLDQPDGSAHWETFIAEAFLSHIQKSYDVRTDREGTVITGISMGGFGSLKIAFRSPEKFLAVAAMEPAVDPALRVADLPLRNTFLFGDNFPPELAAATRSAESWEANQPACRAKRNADAIRDSGLAIYLEVGDEDGLNLHDGTEFLHRVLWDLDISHEYHLVRGADHLGPSLGARIFETFSWLGKSLLEANLPQTSWEPNANERAWMAWAQQGFTGEAPQRLDPISPGAPKMLRMQFAPAREQAAKSDPTVARRYGKLPSTD